MRCLAEVWGCVKRMQGEYGNGELFAQWECPLISAPQPYHCLILCPLPG